MGIAMSTKAWTIFDLLCLEHPEISWEQDTAVLTNFQGALLREVAIGPLRAVFHDD